MRGLIRCAAAVVLLGAGAAAAAPFGGTMVWESASRDDFVKGDLDGVVVTGAGRVVSGYPLTPIDLGGPAVFALATAADGTVWAATGRPAELHHLSGGTSRQVLAGDKEDIAFTCCTVDAQGTVWVGAFPSGKVYRRRADGTIDAVALPDPYVWTIAVDGGGNAYAGTGPEGKVYRIGADGSPSLVYDSEEKNVISLALEPDGGLLFGTAEKGILFRRAPDGTVTAVHDFAEREIRAIVRTKTGLFVGTNAPQKGFDQKAFAEALASTLGRQDADGGGEAGKRGAEMAKLLRGAVYHRWDDGRVEQLVTLQKNYLLGLAPAGEDGADGVYIACGAEGQVLQASLNGTAPATHVVFDLEEKGQVLALTTHHGKLRAVGCGGPGRLFSVGTKRGGGRYRSPVHDCRVSARFGRLTANHAGDLTIETRQGNTAEPGKTWSAWATPGDGGAIAGPRGRYLQYRVTFGQSETAWLDRVSISYLPDNRRPVLNGARIGTKARGSLYRVIDVETGPKLKIAFKASDPDHDALETRIYYRLEGGADWVEVPERPVTKVPYQWDTTEVPDGVYRLRIVASDAPGNARGRGLQAVWESRPVVVDHTRPAVQGLAVRKAADGWEAAGTAADAATPIIRIRVAVGNGPWQLVLPADGNLDQRTEPFTAALGDLAAGRHRVRVQVTDGAGNTGLAETTVEVK